MSPALDPEQNTQMPGQGRDSVLPGNTWPELKWRLEGPPVDLLPSRPAGRIALFPCSSIGRDMVLKQVEMAERDEKRPASTFSNAIQKEKFMTRHIYSVGQHVSFDGRGGTYLKRAGVFTITKLLPPVGTELQYRIKSDGEAYERVASEHELQAQVEKSIAAAEKRSPEADAAHVFGEHP